MLLDFTLIISSISGTSPLVAELPFCWLLSSDIVQFMFLSFIVLDGDNKLMYKSYQL